MNYLNYTDEFSESSFWSKLKSIIGKVSREIVYKSLILFYTYKDGDLTVYERTAVMGALGYLILPIDIVADFIPMLGYTDDIAALSWAYYIIQHAITDEIRAKAKRITDQLLG